MGNVDNKFFIATLKLSWNEKAKNQFKGCKLMGSLDQKEESQ